MGRFVRPEAIEGTTRVTRVFDQVHVVHRACRTVEADGSSLDEVRDRLRRLSRVTHPHLAKLVAVGEEAGRLMVVSEWLPGGQLARSHIPNPGRLLPGVAEALYALHRHGLAHGRITARSFVLDGNQLVKLVDACVHEGSVPEDIEAFGVAMAELYAGREMPPELEQVARDAREGRFGDATLLAQAVQAVCAALPPVSLEPDAAPPPAPPPVAAAPESAEEEDERPLAFWLTLSLLPAVLLLWTALGAGWWLRAPPSAPPGPRLVSSTGPAPAAEPAPASQAVAEAEPAHEAPAEPDAHGAAAPDAHDAPHAPSEPHPPAPTPTPKPYVEGAHEPTPAPVEVAPATPAAPAPTAAPGSTGAWRRTTQAGEQHPSLTLVLDATNTVQDRLGRKGRPRLEVRCANRRLTAALHPGVASVEAVQASGVVGTATVTVAPAGGAATRAELRVPDVGVPVLWFPNPTEWVRTFAATSRVDLTYTPAASPPVVAQFDTGGLPALLGELRSNCAL
jgi:hypothetical protein